MDKTRMHWRRRRWPYNDINSVARVPQAAVTRDLGDASGLRQEGVQAEIFRQDLHTSKGTSRTTQPLTDEGTTAQST